MIVARGVTKSFEGECILDNVDLELSEGEVVGLVGPGGVGKSLLMKILCGLVEPDAGEVHVFGKSWKALSVTERAALRERFGMLFQNYALFDFMNVGENVAFPLRQREGVPEEEILERVSERLTQVDLPGVNALFARELSGGMKKRVALARATIAEAPIIFYDDPTAGLDPVTSSKIFNLIGALQRSESLSLIASHDIERMQVVTQRYIMLYERGVYFRGTAEEARSSTDPVLRTFFGGDPIDVGQSQSAGGA